MGRILVGTAGWTDKTLIASGRFYPRGVSKPEARLRHYASIFPLVEVDASYYALPSEANARLWVERTPDDFTFDVKAFAFLTGHPMKPAALPRELRDALPAEVAKKPRIYPHDVPDDVQREIWRLFRVGIGPLADAGKLGAVLLQFPPWFVANKDNVRIIHDAAAHLAPARVAIELRHASWMNERGRERTRAFLEREKLPYVSVDMPQGFPTSLPPIAVRTSGDLAVVRFHGRNRATWEAKTETAAERFRYLYTDAELEEWKARIEEIAEQTREVHVVMNNCFEDYAVRNARDMMRLLKLPSPPAA